MVFKVNDRVRRNEHGWCWGDQDCNFTGAKVLGTIISIDKNCVLPYTVRWKTGRKYMYDSKSLLGVCECKYMKSCYNATIDLCSEAMLDPPLCYKEYETIGR